MRKLRLIILIQLLLGIRFICGDECSQVGSCIQNYPGTEINDLFMKCCSTESEDVLDRIEGVNTTAACQEYCQQNPDCAFFTWYNDFVISPLSNTCFLYKRCLNINKGCIGCFFGTKNCPTCLVPAPKGGHYYCQNNRNSSETAENTPISNLDYCYHRCSNKLTVRRCMNGSWDGVDPTCDCISPPPGINMTCPYPSTSLKNYDGGVSCQKYCGNTLKGSTVCQDHQWTVDLSEVSCPMESSPTTVIIIVVVSTLLGLCLIVGAGLVLLTRRSNTNRTDVNTEDLRRNGTTNINPSEKIRRDIDYFTNPVDEFDGIRENSPPSGYKVAQGPAFIESLDSLSDRIRDGPRFEKPRTTPRDEVAQGGLQIRGGRRNQRIQERIDAGGWSTKGKNLTQDFPRRLGREIGLAPARDLSQIPKHGKYESILEFGSTPSDYC
ncbi:uncharacterized protein LOC111705420 isoform X2 [Eurytemora carolleeae]|uniref:uncharacterized protein LOC111705420 isoform X2 n=1 Tax=Eurytemora carolleeae TaxID=1294199 RepID=UPI000C7656CA|nr:uncharacterized protein LOC111705420 isoform X2 [Eurytemora carolleeae]|eukprot:XP_023333732.1 uncharacterized protein LOC111705420 isoform X2 [Eurytemora affinis]